MSFDVFSEKVSIKLSQKPPWCCVVQQPSFTRQQCANTGRKQVRKVVAGAMATVKGTQLRRMRQPDISELSKHIITGLKVGSLFYVLN